MELRTAAACRENRQAGRQNSICCERTRQGSIPSKRPTSSRLLCLLYLLLHKDYRRHGIYGEIRSGTRHNGVQRLQFRCERLASGPTACEERMKKRPCTKHEGDFRAFGEIPIGLWALLHKNKPPLFGGGSSCILKNVEFNFTEFRFSIIWRGSAWPDSTIPWRPNTMILQNGILDIRCESYII